MPEPLKHPLMWFELLAALVLAAAVWKIVEWNWRSAASVKVHVAYLRDPAASAVSLIAVILPLLTGVAAYLFVNYPTGSYPSVLAAILLTIGVMVTALWISFSWIRVADATGGTEIITLNMPDDRRFVFFRGLMYVWLVLGLCFAAYSVFIEVPASMRARSLAPASGMQSPRVAAYYLAKPPLRVGQSADDVRRIWGDPTESDPNTRVLTYATEASTVRLTFDAAGRLQEVREAGRGP